MARTYQNCSFSTGKDAESVPVKTVVSASDMGCGESVKTVAFEQLPVYVPTLEERCKHVRALMITTYPTPTPMFRYFRRAGGLRRPRVRSAHFVTGFLGSFPFPNWENDL